jgi:hypothetical protein
MASNDPREHQLYFEATIGYSSYQIVDVGWPGLAVTSLGIPQFVSYKKKRLWVRQTMTRAICHTSAGCHWLLNGKLWRIPLGSSSGHWTSA